MSTKDNRGLIPGNEEIATPFNASMGITRQILDVSPALTNTLSDQSRNRSHPLRLCDVQDDDIPKMAFAEISNITIVLKNSLKNSLEDLQRYPNDVERCSLALGNIIDCVSYEYDAIAIDFINLDGFSIVSQFLSSQDNEIVQKAAEAIGVAAESHPRCQETALSNKNIFSSLFGILKSNDHQDSVKVMVLFAISSIIQDNKVGLNEFAKVNGYEVFMHLLKVGSIHLKLNTCSIIDYLCSEFPQIKSILLEIDYISCLLDLLTKIPIDKPKKTVLSAILSLVEGCYDAVEECKKEEYDLIATLDYLIAHDKKEKYKVIKLKKELNRFST